MQQLDKTEDVHSGEVRTAAGQQKNDIGITDGAKHGVQRERGHSRSWRRTTAPQTSERLFPWGYSSQHLKKKTPHTPHRLFPRRTTGKAKKKTAHPSPRDRLFPPRTSPLKVLVISPARVWARAILSSA